MIAAIVAEYFGGLQNGLGSRITPRAANTAYARAWAVVVGAVLLGLLFYLATRCSSGCRPAEHRPRPRPSA